MDVENGEEVVQVNDLGNRSLFLGHHQQPMSVEATVRYGCEANCVFSEEHGQK
ncbi:hypothetical protein Dimus_033997, partial [Dionaea muscipula]